jgi:hypothetical protein
MTTKSALSTLVMARILGRRPTPSRITWTELKCSSPLWQCLCSLLEADFLFFQEASDFGNELHELVRISGNAPTTRQQLRFAGARRNCGKRTLRRVGAGRVRSIHRVICHWEKSTGETPKRN